MNTIDPQDDDLFAGSSGSGSGSGSAATAADEYPWGHVYAPGDDLNSQRAYRPFLRELGKRTLVAYGNAIWPAAAGYGANTTRNVAAIVGGGLSMPTVYGGDVLNPGYTTNTDTVDAVGGRPYQYPLNGRLTPAGFQSHGGGAPVPFPADVLTNYGSFQTTVGGCLSYAAQAYALTGSGRPPIQVYPTTWQELQLAVLQLSYYFIDPALKGNNDPDFWQGYGPLGNGVTTGTGGVYEPACAAPDYNGTGLGGPNAPSSSGSPLPGPTRAGGNTFPQPLGNMIPLWPGTCGFTRKRFREITSLAAAGKPGQRALFCVSVVARYQDPQVGYVSDGVDGLYPATPEFANAKTAAWTGIGEVMQATPADQWRFSQMVMEYGPPSGSGSAYDPDANGSGGSGSADGTVRWRVSADQGLETVDVLTFHGICQEGDHLGEWIANELTDAIDQLTVLLVKPAAGMLYPLAVNRLPPWLSQLTWLGGCATCADGTCRGSPNSTINANYIDPAAGDPPYTSSPACVDPLPYGPFSSHTYDGSGQATGYPVVRVNSTVPGAVTFVVYKTTLTGGYQELPSATSEKVVFTWSGAAKPIGWACTRSDEDALYLIGPQVTLGIPPVPPDGYYNVISYGDEAVPTPDADGNGYVVNSSSYAYVEFDFTSVPAYGPGDVGFLPCDPIDGSATVGSPTLPCNVSSGIGSGPGSVNSGSTSGSSPSGPASGSTSGSGPTPSSGSTTPPGSGSTVGVGGGGSPTGGGGGASTGSGGSTGGTGGGTTTSGGTGGTTTSGGSGSVPCTTGEFDPAEFNDEFNVGDCPF